MGYSLYEPISLVASAARTATGQSSAVRLLDDPVVRGAVRAILFELDLTAAAAAAGDTLDVTVQTQLDDTNWIDVVHFTQAVGDGSAKRFYARIDAAQTQAMFEAATALTAGNIRNLIGRNWRASWTVVDAGPHTQSFTFSLSAVLI